MGTPLQDVNDAAKLADTIRNLIEDQGLTRADVHRRTGMASSTFYDKLDHRPNAFTIGELGRIAKALGVTLTVILGES